MGLLVPWDGSAQYGSLGEGIGALTRVQPCKELPTYRTEYVHQVCTRLTRTHMNCRRQNLIRLPGRACRAGLASMRRGPSRIRLYLKIISAHMFKAMHQSQCAALVGCMYVCILVYFVRINERLLLATRCCSPSGFCRDAPLVPVSRGWACLGFGIPLAALPWTHVCWANLRVTLGERYSTQAVLGQPWGYLDFSLFTSCLTTRAAANKHLFPFFSEPVLVYEYMHVGLSTVACLSGTGTRREQLPCSCARSIPSVPRALVLGTE